MHEDEFKEEVTTEPAQRADVLITHTVVLDTLHAEPLNSVHSKEVAGYWDVMNKIIEEKEIAGEEIIPRNGMPAFSLYKRPHAYIATSERCWLGWVKNRHRYVRRLGNAPIWTGLLLTSSDGQVCHEERAEQTLSTDKTVKDLTWLPFCVPPNFELQPGRVNAVCRRIRRMLKFRQHAIDDDNEGLGDDARGNSRGRVQEGDG